MAKKKLTSALGVDIGSQKIKICEVRLTGGSPSITAIGMADTPPGAVDHTGLYDADSVASALKALVTASGVTVSHVIVSISGQNSVLVRTVEVPRMNANELKQHMEWEIARSIPFSESTVVSDFKSFEPSDPAAQNMDVVMAISPQSAIDTVIKAIRQAGKMPAAIDVEPLGIARSLTMSGGSDIQGKTVCVVEVGHKTTSINIYRDGQLLMPRQVPIGGEMFTRAIADGLGISVEEAEQTKIERAEIPASASQGFGAVGGATQQFQPYNPFSGEPSDLNPALTPSFLAPPSGEPEPVPESDPSYIPPAAIEPAPPVHVDDPRTIQLYNAIASVVEEFVAEIRRSIDYYRSKGSTVDRIVLCGGGSKIKGMAEFLGKMLDIPAQLHDPMQNLAIGAKRIEPGTLEHHRQEFAVAVGNGLHIAFE